MLANARKYQDRVHLMDTLRGVIIIGVVIYHTLVDLYLFGVPVADFLSFPFVEFIRDWGAGMMIFMCGICCNLSRSNLIRGLECLGIAVGLSLVTYFFMRDNFIYFGILHFLAIAILLYHLIFRHFVDKLPGWTAILFFVLFLFIFQIPSGQLGFFYQPMVRLPEFRLTMSSYPEGFPGWLEQTINYITTCCGMWFAGRDILVTNDYFPILPWILFFLSGAVAGRYIKRGQIPKFFYKDLCKPITWIGTKTLYIYILHQPIVYGLLMLVFNVILKDK